jgi:SPP1 gp7 family putative phage head morphogenesis protein
MAKTANENLLDHAISHQIGLTRLSTATVRKIIALLNRSDNDLVQQLLKYDPTGAAPSVGQKRLTKLLDAIRTVAAEAYEVIRNELTRDLDALAVYEGDFQTKMIDASTVIKVDVVTPTPSQLHAAVNSRPFQGRLLKDWYNELEEGAQKRLRQAVQISYTEGETIDQMVRRVRGTKAAQFRDGILEINRRGAETLVRTAVNHTANAARNELYNANDDLVKGVQWVATLDARTTLLCASRDGTMYPVDSGPRPPAHPNCRSTTVPVLKSWKELGIKLGDAPEGTRASMDGQVPASTTYQTFLTGKPTEFQDDVLGATRGKLFREGGLTLDRFVDRAGQEYTLDQLRARESSAFEKAGL